MKGKKNFKGLIQVYTGNGKGKTTAALGLSLRAAGHRLPVLFIQFLKGGIAYGELKSARKLSPFLKIVPMGRKLARQAVMEGEYPLVVLDEINVAVHYGLVPLKELLTLMANKPDHVELVLTGRWAKPAVIRRADLVTEMKEIKHYYRKGVDSRIGIER